MPLFLVPAFLLFSLALGAQDIHFSQFGNSPVNLSPGLIGAFGGDTRFVANYRNQWRSGPIPLVPYLTFSGSVENKFYFNKGKYDRYITAGVLFDYDRQGALALTSTQIGIPISLTHTIGRNKFITLGVTPAFGQRAFSTNNGTFDSQFNGCFFDPNSDIHEDQFVQNNAIKYFDLAAGANLRLQANDERSRLDLGAGLHHINRPSQAFWDYGPTDDPGQVRLRSKMSLYAVGLMQLTSTLDLTGQASYQKQGTYREIVYGLGARFHLNRTAYDELALQIGVDFRHRYSDAFIPHVEVLWRTWTLGFSYDMNSWSEVKTVTNGRGGPEVALIYRLYKVKPLPVFKSCPFI
ncbi:MAG: PorP/SprF family type IX secretion system membrane protein [Saprospiraceae bacterium]